MTHEVRINNRLRLDSISAYYVKGTTLCEGEV